MSLPRSTWCFWLVETKLPHVSNNQKHYLDLGSDMSSVWNFCAHYSGVILRGPKWRPRETAAVFSGCSSLNQGREHQSSDFLMDRFSSFIKVKELVSGCHMQLVKITCRCARYCYGSLLQWLWLPWQAIKITWNDWPVLIVATGNQNCWYLACQILAIKCPDNSAKKHHQSSIVLLA